MKKRKLVAALAAALVLSGCELITGAQPDDSSNKPSVHGSVTFNLVSGSTLDAGTKLRVTIQTAAVPKQARVAAAATYTKDIVVSASGTFSYAITGVADGTYTGSVGLVDPSDTPLLKPTPVGSNIVVTGGEASVPTVLVTYDNSKS